MIFRIREIGALIFIFGAYRLDPDRLEFMCDEKLVPLEPQVFRLLQHLIEHRDRVVSKDELFEQIWQGRIVSDATLNSRINAARRAVGDNGKAQAVIRTVSKRGYRFVAEPHIEPKVSAKAVSDNNGRPPPGSPGSSVPMASKSSGSPDHSLVVREFEVDGNEKTRFLAKGLRVYLHNSFSRHSTIEVIRETPPSQGRAEFVLEGSVRGRGGSMRLTFSLIDRARDSQIWSERFDRRSEDLFELEEEIGRAVSAAIRVKLKDVEFERLKDSIDEKLSVNDLLNKSAAYFVNGPGNNDLIEAALRLAVAREPDTSMAVAMLAHSLWRGYEFSPLALPEKSKEEIIDIVGRLVQSEPQMDRNRPPQAALLWLRGEYDIAAAAGDQLRDKYRGLSASTRRPVWIGQGEAAAQLDRTLRAIGL